jgi:hypothetical protein
MASAYRQEASFHVVFVNTADMIQLPLIRYYSSTIIFIDRTKGQSEMGDGEKLISGHGNLAVFLTEKMLPIRKSTLDKLIRETRAPPSMVVGATRMSS